MGSSKHWSEALEAITGERVLNASAILEYFNPLYKYLKKVNGQLSSEELSSFLSTDYEEAASKISTKQVLAEWDLETDVENKTKAEVQVTIITSSFACVKVKMILVKRYFRRS